MMTDNTEDTFDPWNGPDRQTEDDDFDPRERDVQEKVETLRRREMAKDRLAAEKRAEARERMNIPTPLSVAELVTRPRDTKKPLIDLVLPHRGKAVLTAPAKGGKTTLTMNVCRTLVTGEDFLGYFEVNVPGDLNVHVIDNEMTEDDLIDWYQRMGMPDEAMARITVHQMLGYAAGFDPLTEESRAYWVERLRGADVVILDCLSPFMAALGLDENHEAGGWLAGIDALMAEAGVPAYVVVHHTGHAGERARGDSKILGWPNQIVTLVVDNDDPDDVDADRFLKAVGRLGAMPSGRLELDKTHGLLTYIAGDTRAKAKARRKTEKEDEERWQDAVQGINEHATDGEWWTSGTLAKWMEVDPKTAKKAIRTGVGKGFLLTQAYSGGSGNEYCLVHAQPWHSGGREGT